MNTLTLAVRNTLATALFAILSFSIATGQDYLTPEQEKMIEKIKANTQVDYHNMLGQLGIKQLRPGVSMDPAAPNPVNYDETKANPFIHYPLVLTNNKGQQVVYEKDWWEGRRGELLEHFSKEIYGRVPENVPTVTWEVVETKEESFGDLTGTTKTLIGRVDNNAYPELSVEIELSVTTPSGADGAVPVILELSFELPPWIERPEIFDRTPDWHNDALAKGWGFATLITGSVQPDNGAGLREGIIGLVNQGDYRMPEDWGALRAWAWGASRAMDYFESDADVDAEKVGITGHSRYGKAAAVAMAYDQRFAIAYVSSAGAGGIKPFRRNYGEVVENLASSGQYHWFAGNFIRYAGPYGWDDIPVDAHALVALCAPRPVFVGCGSEGDEWTDPRGMFVACAKADEAYAFLGGKTLGTLEFPGAGKGLTDGDIAYRQHTGGHTAKENWPYFLEFAGRYFE